MRRHRKRRELSWRLEDLQIQRPRAAFWVTENSRVKRFISKMEREYANAPKVTTPTQADVGATPPVPSRFQRIRHAAGKALRNTFWCMLTVPRLQRQSRGLKRHEHSSEIAHAVTSPARLREHSRNTYSPVESRLRASGSALSIGSRGRPNRTGELANRKFGG
jgi:hypothetical protein